MCCVLSFISESINIILLKSAPKIGEIVNCVQAQEEKMYYSAN